MGGAISSLRAPPFDIPPPAGRAVLKLLSARPAMHGEDERGESLGRPIGNPSVRAWTRTTPPGIRSIRLSQKNSYRVSEDEF
jgi:hypothetical protein